MRPLPEIIEGLDKSEIRADRASTQMTDVANGPVGEYVETDDGPVPTIKQWYAEQEELIEGVYVVGEQVRQDKIETDAIRTDAINKTEQIKQEAVIETTQIKDQAVQDTSDIKQQAIDQTNLIADSAEQSAVRAEAAAVDFNLNGVKKVELAADNGGSLVVTKLPFAGTVPLTTEDRVQISALDFRADPTGVLDAADALEAFWAHIKTQTINLYPATLPFCKQKYVIPPGVYKLGRSLNWTNMQVRNLQIEASGALFLSSVNNNAIVDMTGARGVYINDLCIIGTPESKADSAVMIGPIGTVTCGRNRFSNVMIMGRFNIAAFHNHGSETTLYDACHFTNLEGFAMAADCSNVLGAKSLYANLRSANVPVSFTNNKHVSCTFVNSDKTGVYKDSVYLQGTGGWEFDHACYFLAWHSAPIQIREISGTIRNSNLRLNGLFETSMSAGIDYAVRVVANDGIFTAISGFQADFSQSHAKLAVIRVETPSGADMTSGAVQFPIASIRHDAPFVDTLKLFDGARISMNGEIFARNGAMVNVKDLVTGYGSIFTPNVSTVPSFAGNSTVAFSMHGGSSLSGNGMQFNLPDGVNIGFQGGTHPRVRALGEGDRDLWLQGAGDGLIREGVALSSTPTPLPANARYFSRKLSNGTVIYVPYFIVPPA